MLAHERRRVVHFNVTSNPTAAWTAQQMVEAFPYDTAPRYLLRDRDSIFAATFRSRARSMGIEEVRAAPRCCPSSKARTPRDPYLDNHLGCLASIDFFVVPTATLGFLFAFRTDRSPPQVKLKPLARRTPTEMAAVVERHYQAVYAKPVESKATLAAQIGISARELDRPMS